MIAAPSINETTLKSSFFKPRKFQDERDLEAQLAAWVLEANTKTPSRATNEIPETRRREELPRLRPVKVFPETLALRIPIFVGPTAEVVHDGVPYTMPPEATHIAGTLFLYEDRVRIVAGRFESEQRRRKKGDPPSPVPEHRAAKIAAVHGDRAKLYEKREQLLKLGKSALALLTDITHREPQRSRMRVEERYELLEEHGDERLRAAIERAVAADRTTLTAVRSFLPSSDRDRERSSAHAARAQPRGPTAGARRSPTRRAEPKRGAR